GYAASIGFLRRQFTAILFGLLLCLVAGAVYILTTEARYTGHAILIVETPKLPLFQSQAAYATPDPANVETQLEILNSDDIALSVIKDLHLDEDAEFVSPPSSILRRMVELTEGAISAAVHAVLPRGAQPSTHGSPEYTALATFHQRLKIKRVGLTYAIEINFDSRNPCRAAEIANAIAVAYELNAFQAKYQVTDREAKWLQERLQDLREQASNAERATVDYKTKNNIIDTGGRLMNEQQLAEFNSELIQARTATAEKKARLDRVQQIVVSGDIDPGAADTATVADTLRNDVITKLRTQYFDNERRAEEWAAKYGSGHLAVVELRN